MKGVADFTLIKRILRYVIPYKVTFFVALFLTISLGGLSLARPILIMIAVDDYIVPADLDGLGRITILLVVLFVLEAFVQFVQSYMANWLGQTVIKDLRVEVFKHISKFRLKFFDNSPVGTLITSNIGY